MTRYDIVTGKKLDFTEANEKAHGVVTEAGLFDFKGDLEYFKAGCERALGITGESCMTRYDIALGKAHLLVCDTKEKIKVIGAGDKEALVGSSEEHRALIRNVFKNAVERCDIAHGLYNSIRKQAF